METSHKKLDTTLAALIHLSTFFKYIVPLGNFIFPLVIWSSKREDKFINAHGKQALNFQISMFLYFIFIICATAAAILVTGVNHGFENEFFIFEHGIGPENISAVVPVIIIICISGILLLALFILELVCVITATVKASDGEYYHYPLSIPFISPSKKSENEKHNNI